MTKQPPETPGSQAAEQAGVAADLGYGALVPAWICLNCRRAVLSRKAQDWHLDRKCVQAIKSCKRIAEQARVPHG